MLVKDKGSDIAVLRTMGATRGSIMRIFSMTGTAIGVVGTVIGLVLGLLVAANAEPLRAFVSDLIGVRDLPAGGVLPLEPALQDRPDGGDGRRLPGAGPQLPRDALSGLARGAVRPGRGAAL